MKNFSKFVLAISSLCCAVGCFFVYQEMNGNIIESGSAIVFNRLSMALVGFGLVSMAIGVSGYFRSRRKKIITPLVYSLNIVVGALAILIALYFQLP